MWVDRKQDKGPFDIIGDIHGCYDELIELLLKLGYHINDEEIIHPHNRKAIYLGDLVDRGPNAPAVVELVMNMVGNGQALCIEGNHEVQYLNWVDNPELEQAWGLKETVEQMAEQSDSFREKAHEFMRYLPTCYLLDEGKLVVTHACWQEHYLDNWSEEIRHNCLYGEGSNPLIRYDWGQDYQGKTIVVYGHSAVSEAQWKNNSIDIDTGCVYGGQLTALRYPEKEIVSVMASKTHYS